MGIKTLALPESPELHELDIPTPTGTANFAEDGVAIPNGVHLICKDDDALSRKQITFKTRVEAYDQKSGTYTKAKRSISVAKPITLADGKTSFITFRGEIEFHPSAQVSEIRMVQNLGIGAMTDAGTQDFWIYGTRN